MGRPKVLYGAGFPSPKSSVCRVLLAHLAHSVCRVRIAHQRHLILHITFVLTICVTPVWDMGGAIASEGAREDRPSSRVNPSSCPSELEALVENMLPDLPSYANRIFRRDRRPNEPYFPTYFITAGRPEFEPLPLAPGRQRAGDFLDNGENADSTKTIADDTRQVFMTTLARQYREGAAIEIQEYHWLFLTKSSDGWRLALMFSIEGSYPAGEPTSPPEESSSSVMGRAIRLWLQDCRV